ncbi:MAG: HupE/UreJ family protein [Verrucomicrobiae bacterium]|nr:HupE/UreJ family protein [Verrucomicrobiae bacterium]
MNVSPASARLRVTLLVAVLLAFPFAARAHKVSAVSVVSDFDTKTKAFKVELAMDVDPSGDPTLDDQVPPDQAARVFATEALTIYFDDQPMKLEPEIRIITASDEDTPAELTRKKVIGTLRGTVPDGAENFLLHVNETTSAAVVMVTVKDGKPARRLQVLYPGEFSNPVSLAPVIAGDPFTENEKEKANNESGKSDSETPGSPAAEPEPAPEDSPPSVPVKNPGLGHWLGRGFLAILPSGIDYWLFMLAMFTLSLRAKPLGWQVGLYTIAHSLTLALGAFGLVKISPHVVVAVVAISALYPALENLFINELKPWRGAAVLVFGLFHGLGLANLLWSGEPRLSGILTALMGFNLGVEFAQLAVLVICSIVAVALAKRTWFRHAVVVPLCVVIAGISLFRFIDVLWLN